MEGPGSREALAQVLEKLGCYSGVGRMRQAYFPGEAIKADVLQTG